MVRTFKVELNAAHPELPLMEASAIVGSTSTAFISRVPASVGSWHVTKVYAQAEYPDGTTTTVEATVGAAGIYTATLPATQTSGRVRGGFCVLADGIDELGEPVTGYILGMADMAVYTRDLQVIPGYNGVAMHYFDYAPTVAKKGDVAPIDGTIKMYDGTQWVSLGGASDYSELTNKPSINNVELSGNKTGAALGLLSLVGGTLTGGIDFTNKSYPFCINKLPAAYEANLANTPKLAEIASKGFIGWFPGNGSYLVMSQYDLNGWPDMAWSDGEHEYGILLEDSDADGSLFLNYYNGTESQSYHLQPYGGDIAMQYYIALAFSENKDYAQGAIVYKDGFIYKALVHHRGAWNASHFELTTIAAAIESATSEAEGKADPSLIGIPAFSTELTYTVGAKVVYSNAIWNCTTAVSTAGAWTGATNWTKLFDLATAAPAENGTSLMTNGQVYTALAGKADASALRYALGETITATATLADRTNNKVVPAADNTSDIKLYFPAATGGKARDFIVVITNTTGNTGKISFKVPSGATVYGDAFKDPIASGETWIYSFTEIATNEFFAKAQKVEDPYKALYWGLYFEAEEDGAEVSMSKTGSPTAVSLETSTDGATWTTFDAEGGTTPITLAHTGDRVYFRAGSGGNTVFASDDSNYHAFTLSKKCGAYGNIMSILADNSSNTTISANGAFRKLFFGCSNLTAAPTLAATTLTSDCYGSMFKNCTSLEAAPLLPATTLASGCYAYMFDGCTALVDVPPLPAMTMAKQCYYCMFSGCTALTTAPALPATTLASQCYLSMFESCTALTTAPVLPATTLASQCYLSMFEGCTALETGPDIRATTVGNGMSSMFWNCSNLNSIRVAFTTWDGTGAWMVNVQTNSGTFYCPAALGTNETITRGTSNCPDNWTVVNV